MHDLREAWPVAFGDSCVMARQEPTAETDKDEPLKTILKSRPISSGEGAVIGLLLGAVGVVTAVCLMPFMPSLIEWIEMDMVLGAGVVSGFFVAIGVLVMSDDQSWILLSSPALVVSAAIGYLVWTWAAPSAFAALSLSWLAVAVAVGRATWKMFQRVPSDAIASCMRDPEPS